MARILFTTLPSDDLGLLARSLPVARELSRRGHAIAFCNPAFAPRQRIAAAGFENLPLPRRSPWQRLRAIPTRFASPTAQMWNVDHMLAMTGMLSENHVRAEVDLHIELMQNADLVVDALNPAACAAARIARKPLATLIQVDMHPLSQGLIWWKGDPPPGLPGVTPVFNRILGQYGLPSLQKVEQLFQGNLTIAAGIPETDPLPAAAGVIYVGALLWDTAPPPDPEWFAGLRQDQPVVWVYPGNPRYLPIPNPLDGECIIRDCIRALAGEPLQVVLSLGGHPLPRHFRSLPANFHHEAFVPAQAMAARADLLIHHGGYGSCQTGMLAGKPAVIIPTFSERESNARRVMQVGAAEVLPPSSKNPYGVLWGDWGVDPVLLRETVWKVLQEPSYTAHAAAIHQKFSQYGGAAAAADAIERLFSR